MPLRENSVETHFCCVIEGHNIMRWRIEFFFYFLTVSDQVCFHQFFPRIMSELSEIQEFYDPDTVELMTWIK